MAKAVRTVNTVLNVAIIGRIGFAAYELYHSGFFDFLKNTGDQLGDIFGSHGGSSITGKDGTWWLCKLSGYCPPDNNGNPNEFKPIKTTCEEYGPQYIVYNEVTDTYKACGKVRLTAAALAWIHKKDEKYGCRNITYYFSNDWVVIGAVAPGYYSEPVNPYKFFNVVKNRPHKDPNAALLPILTDKITYNAASGTYYCDNMSFTASFIAFLDQCQLVGLTYKLTPDHNFLTGTNAIGAVKKKFSIVGNYEMTDPNEIDVQYVKFQQDCHASGRAVRTNPHGDGAINMCTVPGGQMCTFNKITGQIIKNYV